MDITSTLAPHICASSIKIFMNDKEKISEIIHFLCKTSVVPAKVSISGLMEKNDPNDYQALFQVFDMFR
jgi:hypothetical protein